MKVSQKNGSRATRNMNLKNPKAAPLIQNVQTKFKSRLEPDYLLKIYHLMLRTRILEERLIRMYKQSDGYFWIGGPGEEAFNIPLGLHVQKGQGLDFDFLHLHYRSSGILMSMGIDPADAMRQMKNTASDPYSGGRNFVNHYSIRKWNVVPVSSTIETQYLTAIGTGLAQKKHGGTGITIVNGGDAGSAEGDFASCLVWSSRPQQELPILIIVINNEWGISTHASTQHGEKKISNRGNAFEMKTMHINGNSVEDSVFAIRECMAYIRKTRKPILLEAKCSRLYGHSSASGANFISQEQDPLVIFEEQLVSAGIISKNIIEKTREETTQEMLTLSQKVKQEPLPDGSTIYDYIYYGQKGRSE